MAESPASIAELRRRVASPAAAREDRPLAAWQREGLARGRLHELFAAQEGDAGTAAGWGLALALAAAALPVVWLRTEVAEARGGRLSGGGLVELGLDPAALLIGIVDDEAALLRAAADAARCPGVGTLLVEGWGRMRTLDLTATRRLMLAAEASGVTAMLLRVAAEPAPSAAATRWAVAPAPSAALPGDAPGAPAFQIECLRRRSGPAGQSWCVEWNRESRCFEPQTPAARRASPPLPRAGVPVAVDRAAALDPPAPLRRAG